MSSLEQLSIPHPRLRHNFFVSIDTCNEELVESYTVIEKALVSFDIGVENLGMPMPTHTKGSVIVWLQDDIAGGLMTALRKIQQAQDTFNITLNLLDGARTVTEQYTFGQCRMSALQHSILSYESSSDSIKLWRSEITGEKNIPGMEFRGTLKASTARDHVMKLLQIEFMQYGHQVIGPVATQKVT